MAARMKLPLALVAAVVAAEAAVLALRPRDGLVAPAEVRVEDYFTPAQLDRAREFRRPQVVLYVGALTVELAVLVLVVRRPPRWLRRGRRPVLAGAAAGAALSLATSVAPLPISVVSRERAIDVGLVTQSWGGWAFDLVRAWGIGAVIAGAGGAVAVVLLRRMPRRWWIAASGAVVAFGVAITSLQPVLIDPVFNRFEPLPEGDTRRDVLALARRAGVDVGEVYVIDASRRTTAANAYVAGLGRTKRVVLYDTLLERFSPEEVRLVVAHELAHVHYDDVPHGLLYLAIVAPFGLFAAAQVTRRLAPDPARERAAASVPALALSVAVLVPVITAISNQLSRDVEARADTYALELTGEPQTFIEFERRIAVRNVSDPDPPGWRTAIFATHPPTIERIGIGVSWSRGARARVRVRAPRAARTGPTRRATGRP